MKLEKRSSDQAPEVTSMEEKPTQGGNKPVVIYIMVLFIAAFLLMALSFLMHQRSNSEALGELQNSVSAMQEVQATQERIIELQEEIAALKEELEDAQADAESLENQLAEAENGEASLAKEQDALLSLYALMQEYAAKDYEACQAIIQQMEDSKMPERLERLSAAGHSDVTLPHERYQELKEAVEAKLARQGK